MTKNQKKSPASNEDVSERNRIGAGAASPRSTPCEGRMAGVEPEARGHLSEHLRIGESLAKIMEKAIAVYTRENGDTPENRKLAADAAYLSLAKEIGRSPATLRLYIRCYRRFSDLGTTHTLTLKEMLTRTGSNPAAI
ncbi:hypothetical protein LMG28727_06099 [Paraburkholderia kirstenboschensis]|nr:hypothetical protein LMG28727_06099 [Paraburkholderia kirstenboschensis]